MKVIIISILSLLFIGCSAQVIEMSAQPTLQLNDLKDYDSDGVIKARDNCAETMTGAKINHQGCGSETRFTVKRELLVNFEIDSYYVTPFYLPEIESLANFMKKYPDANVTIEGHTSKRGTKAFNKRLSQNRAEAIKTILVNKYAVNEKRVTALGFGFSRLLLQGDDEYIHARNRRIVAEISSEEIIKDLKWTIYSVDAQAEL